MEKINATLILLFFITVLNAQDITERSALTTEDVYVYAEKDFNSEVSTFIEEGEIIEIVEKSQFDEKDPDDNKKFHWYKIKGRFGKRAGWVFGDKLLVGLAKHELPEVLRPSLFQNYRFKEGFMEGKVWFGALSGRLDLYAMDYKNPVFEEVYIIITNSKYESIFAYQYGENDDGKIELTAFDINDVVADESAEIISERTIQDKKKKNKQKDLNIQGVGGGTIQQIFKHNLSLSLSWDELMPSQYKFAEVSKNTIRLAYINYVKCNDYSIDAPFDALNDTDQCLEYVTETYSWRDDKLKYEQLYAKSVAMPKAGIAYEDVELQARPEVFPANKAIIKTTAVLDIIKYTTFKKKDGTIEKYFYIRLPNGRRGYVYSDELGFVGCEHAEFLNQYYLDYKDKVIPPFVKVKN